LGCTCHAREVGPDPRAFITVHVALRADFLVDLLAERGVPVRFCAGQELVEHFLAIGVRQALAFREQPLRPLRDPPARVRREPLLLVEKQLGRLDGARFERVEERSGPLLSAQQGADGRRASRRRQPLPGAEDLVAGFGRVASRRCLQEASHELRRRAHADLLEEALDGARVATERDELPRSGDASRILLGLVSHLGEKAGGDFRGVLLEPLRAPSRGERDEPAAVEGSSFSNSASRLSSMP
jgi:hypothetical protein